MVTGSPVNIKDFGAVGDFNPTTGVGTDDRVAIQAAITYAQTLTGGATVVFPSGRYYLGLNSTVGGNVGAQLAIGSRTVANAANNITLLGQGAEIYQGNTGRMLIISNANNTTVAGLKFYGYMGGAMSLPRATGQYAIAVELNSYNTRITENYFTNFPAWALHVDGDLLDPAAALYVPREVSIYNNTIKQRYGNGIACYIESPPGVFPNTGSLWCVAAIQADGLFIENNIIMGRVDLETNTTQIMRNINVCNNKFLSGWVTPIPNPAASVATYWADEATNPAGAGSEILQTVQYNGNVTLNGDIASVMGNTFENGVIYFYGSYTSGFRCNISNNYFKLGSMHIGWNQAGVPQATNYFSIANNVCEIVSVADTAFIALDGYINYANVNGNVVLRDVKQVIAFEATYGGSVGSTYYNNNSLSGQSVGIAGGQTRTIVITLGQSAPFNLDLAVSANAFSGGGSTYAQFAVGGIMGSAGSYDVAQLVTFNNVLTVSAVTKNAGNFSFDVANPTGHAGYLTLDVGGTIIPTISIT